MFLIAIVIFALHLYIFSQTKKCVAEMTRLIAEHQYAGIGSSCDEVSHSAYSFHA